MLIAAALCYAWGGILLVLVVAMVAPSLSAHRFSMAVTLFPAVVLLFAITYGLSGYLVHRRLKFGAWLGAGMAVATTALQPVMQLYLMHLDLKPAWLVVNALVLALILASWGRFGEAGRANSGDLAR